MSIDSRLSRVEGNEAGSYGGVQSGVNLGLCIPKEHSEKVRVNGNWAIYQDLTTMWMNCGRREAAILRERLFTKDLPPLRMCRPANPGRQTRR